MTLLLAAGLDGAPFQPACAQEGQGAQEEPPGNCVRVRQIWRTRVLDDERVLLLMRGGPDLVMHLKHRCPQLAFHDFFSYEARLGQLCVQIDHIVTRAGFHCGIERFSVYQPEPAPAEQDDGDSGAAASGR